MNLLKEITLDLAHVNGGNVIRLHQGDKNAASISAAVYNNGIEYRMTGMTIKYDATIAGYLAESDAAGDVDYNVITIPITENMTALPGKLLIDIKIIDGTGDNETILFTQTVEAFVEKSVIDGSTIIDFSKTSVARRLDALDAKFPVQTQDIADGAVTLDKMAAASVGNNQLIAESVSTSKLANRAVTTEKIAHNAVTDYEIADYAVNRDKISDGAVSVEKLHDGVISLINRNGTTYTSTLRPPKYCYGADIGLNVGDRWFYNSNNRFERRTYILVGITRTGTYGVDQTYTWVPEHPIAAVRLYILPDTELVVRQNYLINGQNYDCEAAAAHSAKDILTIRQNGVDELYYVAEVHETQDGHIQYDLILLEKASNKVASLSAASTDDQYPTAKCVYDMIGDVESVLASLL